MMQVFHSIAEIPPGFGPSVAVIGNFDGVHRGHQQILSAIVAEARQQNARSIAITFDPHPEHFLRPDEAPGLLTLIPERLRLLALTGIDAVLILPFNEALCNLSARAFVQNILVQSLSVISIHEGANFRFGHRAEAGAAELREFGREFGFRVTIHSAVNLGHLQVSSSATREALIHGNLPQVRRMLGRSFSIPSTPASGRGIGTRLLVPTVNLAPYPGLLPPFGVYVTHLTIGEHCFQSITNLGNRPTFGAPSFAIESHILNFSPVELTPETPLRLEFLKFLRPEIQWPTPEALKLQIMKDVTKARRFFRLATAKPWNSPSN
jgi:riboflavin kinase/FMN adenylyltransferase